MFRVRKLGEANAVDVMLTSITAEAREAIARFITSVEKRENVVILRRKT